VNTNNGFMNKLMKSIPKQSVAPHLKMMCYIFDSKKQIRHEAYSNKDMLALNKNR